MTTEVQDQTAASWWSHDRPIETDGDDLLGRGVLVDAIASALSGWRDQESIVIGLTGPWGSGKSSVKNLVLNDIGGRPNAPAVLQFNPWQRASQGEIVPGFFQDMGSTIGRNVPAEKAEELQRLWERYATTVSATGEIAKSVPALLAWVTLAGGLLFASFDVDTSWDWLAAVRVVAGVAVAFCSALYLLARSIKPLATGLATFFGLRKSALELTMEQEKEELRKLLRSRKSPVLVVVDDVDRLMPDEARALFQLVKANADFPNLIYLLLYDREVMHRTIELFVPERGDEFLDKIVQTTFDIPRPSTRVTLGLVDKGVRDLLAADSKWEEQRWGNMLLGGVGGLFRNLRDVNRYLSSLAIQREAFSRQGRLEVNPVDLASLEALRVFENPLYRQMSSERSLLTSISTGGDPFNDDDPDRLAMERFLKLARPRGGGQAREIVRRLFPASAWTLGDARLGGSYRDEWIKAVRISDELTFDRYFNQSVATNEVSESDLAALVEAAADGREETADVLRSFDKRGMLLDALRGMSLRSGELDLDHVKVLGLAISDVSDQVEQGHRHDTFPAVWTLAQVVRTLMQRFVASERAEVLREIIRQSNGLTLPVYLAQYEEDEKGARAKDPEVFIVEAGEAGSIVECVRERLKERFADGAVLDMPDAFYWFKHWTRWDDPDASNWLRDVFRDADKSARFLSRFVTQTQVWGQDDKVPEVVARFDFSPLLSHVSAAEVIDLVPWDAALEGDDATLFQSLREVLDAAVAGQETE